jgi:hypothetical protein
MGLLRKGETERKERMAPLPPIMGETERKERKRP